MSRMRAWGMLGGWSSRYPRSSLVAGGILSGLLTALSVPPFGFWPLAFAGVAGLYLLLARSGGARRGAFAGAGFGIGFFGLGYGWVLNLVAGGWVALVVFESLITALACLPPAWILDRARRSGGDAGLAAGSLAAMLTLADAFRWSWPFGGMPIGGVDLGQASAPLGQLARIGGPLLVELATFLIGAFLGLALLSLARTRPLFSLARTRSSRQPGATSDRLATSSLQPETHRGFGPTDRLVVAGGVALLVVVVCAVAAWVAPDGGAPVGSLRVAAVQGGGPRGLHAIFTDSSAVYERQLAPTLRLPVSPHVDLVLWPEDVITLDGPLSGSTEEAQVASAAHRLGATLVAGVTQSVGTTKFLNEAVAWSPEGSVVATYEKAHRVPFGEYIPFRSLFSHLGPTGLVPRDAIAGHAPGLLRTPAGRLGVMISFEVFYPARAASAVGAGARVLLVPTNDASYSTGQVPAQEVAADQLRAIGTGRDLVQAAPTGYTDVVDNRGRLLARTSLGSQAVIEERVPLLKGTTFYEFVGDWPVIALCLLVVVLGLAASSGREPSTGARQPREADRREPEPVTP